MCKVLVTKKGGGGADLGIYTHTCMNVYAYMYILDKICHLKNDLYKHVF